MKRIIKWSGCLVFVLFLSFISCEKDPCEGVVCQNEGYCTGGDCVCPERYTGSDCSEEVPPSRMDLYNVTVNRFPQNKEDGSPWDADGNPDLNVGIYDEDGNELWRSSAIYEDADGNQDYSFQVPPVFSFDQPQQSYRIRLFDFDTEPPDELMGEITFTPYMPDEGFPVPVIVGDGDELEFALEVEYF